MKNKILSILLIVTILTTTFAGCSSAENQSEVVEVSPNESLTSEESTTENIQTITDYSSLNIDNTAWNYNTDDDVYWQNGIVYCENPADITYESMGVYVPAAYMTGTDNGDGTFTCVINTEGVVNGYTAETAPMVVPVNTPGYAAMAAPTEYTTGLSAYLDAGFVYVFAGARGRISAMGGFGGPGGGTEVPVATPEDTGAATTDAVTSATQTTATQDDLPAEASIIPVSTETSDAQTVSGAAPWGVTDLKAAIRYLRYNAQNLPGDTDRIVTFGMSGGGAQSALVGATGDSILYTPYLKEIGAAMTDTSGNAISDGVYGTMAWCPITSLDYANEAYEWNIGQFEDSDTRASGTFTNALSDDLAEAYALYINELELETDDQTVLTLETSADGIYTLGSYYDYLITVVEESLNNFLVDTTFPYTPDNRSQAGFAGNAGGNDGATTASTETTSYTTIEDYIDFLNTTESWVTYDAATNKATVSSMSAFINVCKNSTKTVGAFDSLSLSAGENGVFGTDENDSLHFDSTMASLIEENQAAYSAYSDWDASYPTSFAEDIAYVDSLGTSIADRQNAYNPMYYLSDYYAGYGSSTVAPNWRIRTGINQGDTALTVETNLALALNQYDSVDSVDFATIWGKQHTTAERTGDATTNFIAWVEEICQ